MATCHDPQMLWAAEVLMGMRNCTVSTLPRDVETKTDRPQVLGMNSGYSIPPPVARAEHRRSIRISNTPRWIPDSSQIQTWTAINGNRRTASNTSISMMDGNPCERRSVTSRFPLPGSSTDHRFQREPVSFAPQIDLEAVVLSDKVSNNHASAELMQLSPDFASAPGFPAPTTSDLNLALEDISVEAESQRLEAEVNNFLASLDRELYGHATCGAPEPKENPIRPHSLKESGEISDDQQPARNVLKREHESSSPRPAKRARRNPPQATSMISATSHPGKRYYSGPYLERAPLYRQESYIPVKRLGTGGQGTAHLLKASRRGSLVVCKVIPHTPHHSYSTSELAFLRDCLASHPRIVRIRSALVSPTKTQLYLDYYNGGDLASFMDKYFFQGVRIPDAFIWHCFLQLSEALAYIHTGYDRNSASLENGYNPMPENWLPVIHRDIKPANILLQRAPYSADHPGPEPYPRLVLADFGLALQAAEVNVPPTSDYVIGTFRYQPPECPHHSVKGDVWSLGSVIYEMVMG
ncbi:MAG: hypothetical protein Q9170_008349, partial [Blastenia crenularia]